MFTLLIPLGEQHARPMDEKELRKRKREGTVEKYCDNPEAYRELPAAEIKEPEPAKEEIETKTLEAGPARDGYATKDMKRTIPRRRKPRTPAATSGT